MADDPLTPALGEALALLAERAPVVLTGAGMSTDSGIPDYRGPDAPVRRPMTFADFRSGPEARRRYWARSHLGWGTMRHAEPNDGHRSLARLGATGRHGLLITQNVDGLHERAGSTVVALHGRISDVVCLDCHAECSRPSLQRRMEELNPGWRERHHKVMTRPDGDVELEETADFVVPACARCDGVLKPDVVFFGENVPKPRVQRCYDAVDACDAVLVLGSSLTVLSGFRFVRRAARAGIPVVIVNRGVTRADDLATYKLHAGTSEFVTSWESRPVGATARPMAQVRAG